MLAREEDEVYSIAYATSLSSFTAPCSQLMQISVTLVQLMGFMPVFTIWGSGQSCLLWQLRRFSLLFLTTPLLCPCGCKQVPCDSGSPSCMGSGLHLHLPAHSPGCRPLPVLRYKQLGNPQQICAKSWKSGCVRDYDKTMPLGNEHYVRTDVTNGWM